MSELPDPGGGSASRSEGRLVDLRRGGRVFKAESVSNHGRGSLQGQSNDRGEAGVLVSSAWHHGLAAASAAARQARFRFCPRARGGIRGRLFLARLSVALPHPSRQPLVLGAEGPAKQDTRPGGQARTRSSRLARRPCLGTRAPVPKPGHSAGEARVVGLRSRLRDPVGEGGSGSAGPMSFDFE